MTPRPNVGSEPFAPHRQAGRPAGCVRNPRRSLRVNGGRVDTGRPCEAVAAGLVLPRDIGAARCPRTRSWSRPANRLGGGQGSRRVFRPCNAVYRTAKFTISGAEITSDAPLGNSARVVDGREARRGSFPVTSSACWTVSSAPSATGPGFCQQDGFDDVRGRRRLGELFTGVAFVLGLGVNLQE